MCQHDLDGAEAAGRELQRALRLWLISTLGIRSRSQMEHDGLLEDSGGSTVLRR